MRSPADNTTINEFDGCAEFDERLLEAAFAPTLDAELDRHIARCSRCARARDMYLTTADVLSIALSSGESIADTASATRRDRAGRSSPIVHARSTKEICERSNAVAHQSSTPAIDDRSSDAARGNSRDAAHDASNIAAREGSRSAVRKSRRMLYALAAASVLIALVWLARTTVAHHAALAIVSKSDDARIELVDLDHAIVRQGTAEFEVGDEDATVETPLGTVHARDARFKLSASRRDVSPELSGSQAAMLVTLAVTSGVAKWSSKDERDIEIGAGETLVRPGATSPENERPAQSGIGPVIGSSASALQSRTAIASSPAELFHVIGRTLDSSSGLPLAACDVHFALRRDGQTPLGGRGRSAEDGTFSIAVGEVRDDRRELAEFASLVPGAPQLLIEHEGFAPYRNTNEARGGTLPAIDATTSLDLGDVRLLPGVRILGHVLSEDGQAVAGATILVGDVMTGLAHPLCFARAIGTTDERGRILVSELLPPLPGSTRFNYALTAISAQGVGSAVFTILDAQNAPTELDIRFGPQCTLDVIVQDPDGGPLADVEVKIVPHFLPYAEPYFPADPESALGRNPSVLALFAARTDSRGFAQFAHLPMDGDRTEYDVAVRNTAFGSNHAEVKWQPHEEHAQVTLRFSTHRGCSVSGSVVDVRGQPVAGAQVKDKWWDGQRSQTDAEGRYRLPDLDPTHSMRSIEVEVPGFPTMIRPVQLSSEHDLENVDFVCKPAVPIEGHVVDQLGAPVVGAQVYVSEESLVAGSPRSLGKCATSADGRFAYSDATDGNWRISVQPPEPVVGWRPFTERVVHGGDRTVECVLERIPGSMTRMIADVVDEETLEPLDPVQVELRPPHSSAYPSWYSPSISRQRGRVTSDAVPAGVWSLWVLVQGRASAFATFTSGERDEVRLTLRVGHVGSIDGRVVFPVDRYESGLTLRASFRPSSGSLRPSNSGEWISGGVGYGSAPLSPDGAFHFDNLVPGRWVLQFSGKDLINEVSVDVPSGGAAHIEIPALIGAHVTVHARASEPDGRVETNLYRSVDGFEPCGCYLYAKTGQPKQCDVTVLPDTLYRWEARFYDASQYDPVQYRDEAREPCRRQSGEVRAKSSETVVIDVPSVPK
jgi:protocatechuate 3,4-dioxygenase beta subunit